MKYKNRKVWEERILKAVQQFVKQWCIVNPDGSHTELQCRIDQISDINRFVVRKDRKIISLFEVEFFLEHSPKRTCTKLTEEEVFYVVKRYCT